MYRKSTTWIVICILTLGSLLGTWSTAVAKDSSGFPDTIKVSELASGEIASAATPPASLNLERVAIPAGASLPARQVVVSEVLYVERGTLTLVDSLGLTSTLAAGKGAHLRAGAAYEAHNDSSGDVSVLRLSLTAITGGASPAAVFPTPATPVASSGAKSATIVSLATYALTDIPKAPATLFLDRATWAPGVDSGPYTQNGPVGMLVESGTLTISSPSGLDGQLGKGKAVQLPADQTLRTRNDGLDNAVALLYGVVPAGRGAVTAAPETTTAGSTSTGSGTVGTVLYQADASGDWAKTGGWQPVSGMLVNDGLSDQPVFAAAPFEASTPDYAIEVEMQWVRGGYTYGVVARGGGDKSDTANDGKDGGYWIGGNWDSCKDEWHLVAWAGPAVQDGCTFDPRNGIAGTETVLDGDWHTSRVEVQGNAIRVFLDGTKVIETTDNRYLASGQVGLWSVDAQVNIRRYTVIALDD